MTERKYQLESIIEILSKHADKADERHRKSVMLFMSDNPDAPLPDYLSDDFNVARALFVMATEIQGLK